MLRPSRLAVLLAAGLIATALLATALAPSALGGYRLRRELFGLGGWTWPTPHEVRALSHRGFARGGSRSRGGTSSTLAAPTAGASPTRSWRDSCLTALRALITLAGCPVWECHRAGFGPPRSAAAGRRWLAFARAAVERYGSGGSFWRSHPGLPYRTVRYWQVINEVNGTDQWPHPSAADYASLLKSTAAAIRASDGSAKVVQAGLGKHMTILLKDYLPALYRQPGFRQDADVVAVEGYGERPRDVVGIMRMTRRIMRLYGDRRKPAWITEMGWATGGGSRPYVTTPRGQAKRLRLSWGALLACRKRRRLKRLYWFPHSDQRVPAGAHDYWG